ncbi:Anti-sigma-K factor RskA [Pararobbsia alpina]|uniref:anti-sigma factor n=1 Tax=Pararobbsia alpina TaxID=621374 RepID=UPI0039A5DC71
MNLHRRPELIDRLAAEYALGTLRGRARHRFDTLANSSEAIHQAIQQWQRRLDAMSELGRAVEPPGSVWLAIESRLGLASATRGADAPSGAPSPARPQRPQQPTVIPPQPEAAPARPAPRWWESLSVWRGIAGVAVAAAIVSIVIALRSIAPTVPLGAPGESRVAYVSVLHDDQSHSTMLVTWDDAHSTVTLRRLSDSAAPSGRDLQLWGIPSSGTPVSLGVLPRKGAAVFKVQHRPQNYAVLAISVEPSGGSPNPNGPTGPVILTGKLVPAS